MRRLPPRKHPSEGLISVLPFKERYAARLRLKHGLSLYDFGAQIVVASQEGGWQAKEPPEPPNALDLAYEVLELKKPATESEVKTAFKKAALKYHPDVGGDSAKFAAATNAKNLILKAIK